MANANPSRLGQVNQAGDVRELFYKTFTGEVMTAFDQKTIMMDKHNVRNIESGKSVGFNHMGRARGRYHSPGTEILGQKISHAETVITIDDLLIADTFISNLDDAMNHYEVRAEYSSELGKALARTFDKQALRAAFNSARSANKITGMPGGSTLTLPAGFTGLSTLARAQALTEAIFKAHQNFVEKDVDLDGVFAVVSPADYFVLVQNKELLNRDWGGLGSYAMADLPMVAGIPLVTCNHIPNQNDTVDGNGEYIDRGDIIHAKYAGDYSKARALVMTPKAIGTVRLLDVVVESEYDIRRQGDLFVAKTLVGTGTVRPECAQEIVLP